MIYHAISLATVDTSFIHICAVFSTMSTTLSSRDNLVLQNLFDSPLPAARASSGTVSLPHFIEPVFDAIRPREQDILRPLAGSQHDNVAVASVIQDLSKLIDEHPQYASAYVNRAQAARLLLPVESLFSFDHASESARIFNDLGRGIELASPQSPSGSTSPHQREVLAAAYTHRGFLLLKAADMVKNGQAVHGLDILASSTATGIEEIASNDFARGGSYGDALGKQMAVKTNPYAKMCGAIVRDALQEEIAAASRNHNVLSLDSIS
jgi:hypothetical protein